MFKSKLQPFVIGILPFIVFIFHINIFGDYIVDDAGILFAYARNISEGFGIVAQPGLKPVEGFSDFLWLMLFVPFFWSKIFDPVITSKILSAIIILFLYIFLAFRLRKELPGFLIFIILSLVSVTTPFAIWNSSGLENPLYILLISLLFYCSYKILTEPGKKYFALSAIFAFLTAITRPDGILYSIGLPLLISSFYLFNGKIKLLPWKHLCVYSSLFAASFGFFLTFRYLYFGELVPNTYYSKGGPGISDVVNILLLKEVTVMKLQQLFSAIVGWTNAFFLIAVILVLICRMFFINRANGFNFALTIFFILSIVNYLLLPYDWMREFRFATPFIVFFYFFLISSLYLFFQKYKITTLVFCLPLLIVSLYMGKDFYSRSKYFAQEPTVPFKSVAHRSGLKFNYYAASLGLEKASLLTPDCGGTLYYSKLRIYDMAGLTDKRYAITTLGKDNDAFYKIVFEIDKPTFIEIHSDWSFHIMLQDFPRFYQDYLAIFENEYNLYGRIIKSGHYVRRDTINNDLELLEKLKI